MSKSKSHDQKAEAARQLNKKKKEIKIMFISKWFQVSDFDRVDHPQCNLNTTEYFVRQTVIPTFLKKIAWIPFFFLAFHLLL